MEKSNEHLVSQEIEPVHEVVETGPDVQKALDKIEVLCDQFESLLEKYGWEDPGYKIKMSIAYREALINGVFHGNYGVGKVLQGDDIVQLAKDRVAAGVKVPPEIRVSLNIGRNIVEATIEDMGQGFDLESVADPLAQKNLLKTSGRGFVLMHDAFADVIHSGPRNQIITLRNTK